MVYDLPEEDKTFKDRIKKLVSIVKKSNKEWSGNRLGFPGSGADCPLIMAEQISIKSMKHMEEI